MRNELKYRDMGERLRERRRMLKLSQEELARMTGVSTSFIGHIERAEKIPSLATIVSLCAALDMTLDEMVLGVRLRCEREKCRLYEEMKGIMGEFGGAIGGKQ